jgi:hypothetical protein
MSIAIPICRRFLIDIASESLSTSLRNHYRHDFGIAIAIVRNPQFDCDAEIHPCPTAAEAASSMSLLWIALGIILGINISIDHAGGRA